MALFLSSEEPRCPLVGQDEDTLWKLNSSSLAKSGCYLCNFNVSNEGYVPDSNEKDLILTSAFNKLQNLFCFARTARTTGYKGRIVVFTNNAAVKKRSSLYFENIMKCGVQVINVGNYTPVDPKGLYYYRYTLYSSFLQQNAENINRVIICDLYDTFFQHDPFTTMFKGDKITFSGEGYKVNRFNKQVMNECFAALPLIDPSIRQTKGLKDIINNGTCINGGLIAGGIEQIIKFTIYMTNVGNPFSLDAYADDQGCLNLFVRSGVFREMFSFDIDNTIRGFLASWATFARKRPDPFVNQTMGHFSRSKRAPAVVHQFDRSHELVNKLINSCPDTDPPTSDYPVFKFSRIDNLPD